MLAVRSALTDIFEYKPKVFLNMLNSPKDIILCINNIASKHTMQKNNKTKIINRQTHEDLDNPIYPFGKELLYV